MNENIKRISLFMYMYLKKIYNMKKQEVKPKKLVDIVRFTHKETTVDVKIDYIYNKISLVE